MGPQVEYDLAKEKAELEAGGERAARVPGRRRSARWREVIDGKAWCFAFDREAKVIVARKLYGRKARTVTMRELLAMIEGQRLLRFED